MAEVNLPSWSKILHGSEGLQLTATAATWENILARFARLETRLVEHERRVAATLPPLQHEPDPPDALQWQQPKMQDWWWEQHHNQPQPCLHQQMTPPNTYPPPRQQFPQPNSCWYPATQQLHTPPQYPSYTSGQTVYSGYPWQQQERAPFHQPDWYHPPPDPDPPYAEMESHLSITNRRMDNLRPPDLPELEPPNAHSDWQQPTSVHQPSPPITFLQPPLTFTATAACLPPQTQMQPVLDQPLQQRWPSCWHPLSHHRSAAPLPTAPAPAPISPACGPDISYASMESLPDDSDNHESVQSCQIYYDDIVIDQLLNQDQIGEEEVLTEVDDFVQVSDETRFDLDVSGANYGNNDDIYDSCNVVFTRRKPTHGVEHDRVDSIVLGNWFDSLLLKKVDSIVLGNWFDSLLLKKDREGSIEDVKKVIASVYVDFHVGNVASTVHHCSATLDADARLIPPRNAGDDFSGLIAVPILDPQDDDGLYSPTARSVNSQSLPENKILYERKQRSVADFKGDNKYFSPESGKLEVLDKRGSDAEKSTTTRKGKKDNDGELKGVGSEQLSSTVEEEHSDELGRSGVNIDVHEMKEPLVMSSKELILKKVDSGLGRNESFNVWNLGDSLDVFGSVDLVQHHPPSGNNKASLELPSYTAPGPVWPLQPLPVTAPLLASNSLHQTNVPSSRKTEWEMNLHEGKEELCQSESHIYEREEKLIELNGTLKQRRENGKGDKNGLRDDTATFLQEVPRNSRFMFLSATVPNAREFVDWVALVHKQPCHIDYTDNLPTPLHHYTFFCGGDSLYLGVDKEGKFPTDGFQEALNALIPASEGKRKEKGKAPQSVVVNTDDEGRLPIMSCVFDPGEDISPRFSLSTLFVASWFPP